MTCINQLKIGHHAVIHHMTATDDLQHRMHALGLREGQVVCVMRRAMMKGPLHLRLGTTDLILRRNDAKHVFVKNIHLTE